MKTDYLVPLTFRTTKAIATALQRQAKRLKLTRSAWLHQIVTRLIEDGGKTR